MPSPSNDASRAPGDADAADRPGWVTAFTLSAIEHEIRIWIDGPEQGVTNIQGEVLLRIWELFREHGIALPREQQDVHVRELPAVAR